MSYGKARVWGVLLRLWLVLLCCGAGGEWALATAEGYVGSVGCVSCHVAQAGAWQGSNHALAMQHAGPQSVLGDFADVRFEHHGQVTRFLRREGRYIIRTDGPDGRQQDFEVAYTFGVFPLQQYLIAMPGGRLQAFGVAWDARPRAAGGQRWYSLYPDDPPRPGESTHWSGREQNWNFMCASCHSTAVRKHYDLATDSYRTSSVESGVGCEACHGPGAGHLRWAASGAGKADVSRGFDHSIERLRRPAFAFRSGRSIAEQLGGAGAAPQAGEVCFGCHSRRQELVADPDPRAPFLDNYLPSLLEPGLYHADGRIDGEVFEYGSFVQSAMYRAGVTCTHCHDSHSATLRLQGNALCTQCHQAGSYDVRAHHRHRPDSEGAACVSCHMPGKTYMGVDFRRDHRLAVPRVEALGVAGAPDACMSCHADRGVPWVRVALTKWRGGRASARSQAWSGAEFLVAWRHGRQPGGTAGGSSIAMPTALTAAAAIARASALSAGARVSLQALAQTISDPDPLVRLGAARSLAALPAAEAARLGAVLLDDARRAVRVEAARSLVGPAAAQLVGISRGHFERAFAELMAVEQLAADRPESHVNRAQIQLRLGKPQQAEAALRDALRLAPAHVPALLNLADLYRLARRDGDAEPLLRRAAEVAPALAEPSHALGLLLVRQGKVEESVGWFEKAHRAAPAQPQHARVFALALHETGRGRQGLMVIDAARVHAPDDAALLRTRILLARGLGLDDEVRVSQRELQRLAEGR